MEPGDSGSRTSIHSISAISIPDPLQRRHLHPSEQQRATTPPEPYHSQRQLHDRRYREQPVMATATVLAPSAHYPPQPTAYSSYPQRQPPSVASPSPASVPVAMISGDHRRPPDEKDHSSRQSLPSISEVISGARPGQYVSTQPNIQPGSNLPSPFTPGPRPYAEPEKLSPQAIHASSAHPPRQENLPSFADSPRVPFNSRHSLPPVSDRRPTPPVKPELPPQHRPSEPQQPSDHHASNGSYTQAPPPPPPTSHPYPTGHLPPGQVPLPTNYPISPRHVGPPPPAQYDPRGQPLRHDEVDYNHRARFDHGPTRHFETWNYQDSLNRIGVSSRTIFNFAEAYGRIAQEQHGSQPIPERLPTEREVIDMLGNVDHIKRSLEQVRDAVQASIQNERAREGTKVKGIYEDELPDVAMYDNGTKPPYAMSEVKKRRGRAAPPGRCHSCNRIDTPEWRRGPDGARTLCNACGLHYAKLERKRQLETRSLRPKPDDRN